MFMAIVGPNAFVPITAFWQRQTAVSHSSTESETIALEDAARSEGLPALTFWEYVVMLFSGSSEDVAPAQTKVDVAKSTIEPTGDASDELVPTGGTQTSQIPLFETFMADKLCE